MKAFKFYSILFIVLALVIIPALVIAGDTFNVAVGGTTGKTNECTSELLIYFYPSMAADSVGSFHSKPMFIGDLNDADAYVTALVNAASDMNIIFHYSNDRTTWLGTTATGLDLCTNAVRYDTLGIGDQAGFHKWQWLVIEVDGQAGCNTTDLIKLGIQFRKDGTYVDQFGKFIPGLWFFASSSITNP
jgi:hypothetical protein